MKILVTGGAGYIGSVLVPKLVLRGYKVTVIDNFMFGQSSLLELCSQENFEIVKGDIRNLSYTDKIIREADLIIPLAALVGAPICEKEPKLAIEVNQDAINILCKNLAQVRKLYFL